MWFWAISLNKYFLFFTKRRNWRCLRASPLFQTETYVEAFSLKSALHTNLWVLAEILARMRQLDNLAENLMKYFLVALALFGWISAAKAESCNFPDSLKTALETAKKYKNDDKCSRVLESFNKSRKGGKIIISDYTNSRGMMYIFDEKGETCLKALPVDYGTGAGKDANPTPSCGAESKQTPAGFHVTDETHDSAKFPQPNSLGLVGLEGQGSLARGILLHGATGDGGAHTWGCSGVAKDEFQSIREMVGGGSLIYNYFGSDPKAPGCNDIGKNKCSADSGATGGGENGGSGAATQKTNK
jgi:hypothetical protein